MKYNVLDNQTGQKYSFEGDKAPTQDDVDRFLGRGQYQQITNQSTQDSGNALYNIPILGPMIHNITNYAQDVGAGLGNQGAVSSAEQMANQANELIKQANATKDPTEKMKLLTLAGQTGSKASDTSQGVLSSYSPDISQPYVQRGFSTAGNIAGLADIASWLTGANVPGMTTGQMAEPSLGKGGLPQIVSHPIQTIQNLNPFKVVGNRIDTLTQRASESGDVVPTNDFIDAFKQDVADRLDPNAKIVKGQWKWADPAVKDYVDEVESYISSKPSGFLEDKPSQSYLDANKLVQLRRYFSGKLPSGFLKWFKGGDLESKVLNLARATSTSTAKGVTPGLSQADLLYSLLSKLSGTAKIGAGLGSGYELIKLLGHLGGGTMPPGGGGQ